MEETKHPLHVTHGYAIPTCAAIEFCDAAQELELRVMTRYRAHDVRCCHWVRIAERDTRGHGETAQLEECAMQAGASVPGLQIAQGCRP